MATREIETKGNQALASIPGQGAVPVVLQFQI